MNIRPIGTVSTIKQNNIKKNKTGINFSGRLTSLVNPLLNTTNTRIMNYNPFINGIMPIEKRDKLFPKDEKYRRELANSLGITDQKKLASIVGHQELKEILKNSKPSNFNPMLDENGYPTNPDFCINLHMHTKYSDGCFEIKDLLEQAQQYAEKTSRPILISISDHDTLEGTKEAIKLIAGNPEKYDKILFVPSIELNAKYQNPSITRAEVGHNYAFQLELLGYSINPFNPKLNAFIEELKDSNSEIVTQILDVFQEEYPELKISIEEAKSIKKSDNGNRTHMFYLGSSGIIDDIKSYLHSKADSITDKTKKDEIRAFINEYFEKYRQEYGSRNVMPKTPNIKEAIKILKSDGFGFVGIAHPAKIDLNGAKEIGNSSLKKIISDFYIWGGNAIEYNYQYPGAENNKGYTDWINSINEFCDTKYPCIIKAGGIDNHGTSIFKR
ncbi:MAG: hypothetical protein IKU37_05425 [Candidatus Gastranaerophilales bacterium]|nr:hypothetical protein [Candidatus Gastranaerophilales bacterium]